MWESKFGDHGYVGEKKELWEVEGKKIVQGYSSHPCGEQIILRSDVMLILFPMLCP